MKKLIAILVLVAPSTAFAGRPDWSCKINNIGKICLAINTKVVLKDGRLKYNNVSMLSDGTSVQKGTTILDCQNWTTQDCGKDGCQPVAEATPGSLADDFLINVCPKEK